jgi:hypothetical protein
MVSPVLTERRHSGGFLVSEARGERSRDQVTLAQQSSGFQGAQSPILPAGVVLGESNASSAVYSADPGNTGTFTCGSITVGAAALIGVYTIEFTAATAFEVFLPTGGLLGTGSTGSSFNTGGLTFTLTAGGVAAVAGDHAQITTSGPTGLWAPLNLESIGGLEIAAGILFNETDASQGNTLVTIISRDCEVNQSELVFPLGATTAEIAAIMGQLKAINIIGR